MTTAGANHKIKKGELGDFSKITEEFQELQEAHDLGLKIHVLVEMADLIGAMDLYISKHYTGVNIYDVIKQIHAKHNWYREKGLYYERKSTIYKPSK